ncbi:nucleoside hydrolase-like domain-containing protein [Pedobacter helvus]|uniref:Nucleoside hydrolase-like domain-containing protein n=1 Tax=Pedobacter helvus TaxID=2563444 RepID=A0ABW9JGW9_9SPHI|nr:nucleoside hydrolase-like domain-containing protein [Pedobacter ureilyticus]
MKFKLFVIILPLVVATLASAQKPVPAKPRILISTDIGGTDPDDNQSLIHLLMYSEKFKLEGLVSSPSFGEGNKEEILKTIDLYEKDLPKLQKHQKGLASPQYLRSITKQGKKGAAPFVGYGESTEGSNWIVSCAKKKDQAPLWILVWGGLDDVAQALHDEPSIQHQIRIYWIGGPNKKWSANSYAYIASNFPNLWLIENNASYYGFFSHSSEPDSVTTSNYYQQYIKDKSFMGRDFANHYKGEIKMGDTPTLLYMMDGNPNDPSKESWGGSFTPTNYSPRIILNETTTLKDTVAYCVIMEFRFKVPNVKAEKDSIYFWMEVPYGKNVQKWPGYYVGDGVFALRYIPKKAEVLHYKFSSTLKELNGKTGAVVVANLWPGKRNKSDYALGNTWFTDKPNPELYLGKLQGGKTLSKWRNEALLDWAKRWAWLNE